MTAEEQLAAINSPTFLSDLIAKAQDTMAVLSGKQLQVDKITFPVDQVPVTIYMPKGGMVARVCLGDRGDGSAVIDLPQVPVAWITPTA